MARRIFANVLEELSLRRREAAQPTPRANYVWSACTHERFSGAVRPEPLRSPPAARDILENRPNRVGHLAVVVEDLYSLCCGDGLDFVLVEAAVVVVKLFDLRQLLVFEPWDM